MLLLTGGEDTWLFLSSVIWFRSPGSGRASAFHRHARDHEVHSLQRVRGVGSWERRSGSGHLALVRNGFTACDGQGRVWFLTDVPFLLQSQSIRILLRQRDSMREKHLCGEVASGPTWEQRRGQGHSPCVSVVQEGTRGAPAAVAS